MTILFVLLSEYGLDREICTRLKCSSHLIGKTSLLHRVFRKHDIMNESIRCVVRDFIKDHKTFLGTVCLTGFGVILLRYWVRKGSYHSTAVLNGKTIIITGASSGIGKETAKDFARRGARVILACRNVEKAVEVANEIRQDVVSSGEVIVRHLDLSSFESVRIFAEQINEVEKKVHILINNAGLMRGKMKTVDGFEIQLGVNHLSHFLLTNLILERIKQSSPARIINVSSSVHSDGKIQWDDPNLEKKENYSPYKAYCQSKLANILFTKELARCLSGTGVNVYAVHPGFVRSDFPRYMSEYMPLCLRVIFDIVSRLIAKTPAQGAQTIIYCALAEELENKSGLYYSACQETTPAPQALDEDAAKRLWKLSTAMVRLATSD